VALPLAPAARAESEEKRGTGAKMAAPASCGKGKAPAWERAGRGACGGAGGFLEAVAQGAQGKEDAD